MSYDEFITSLPAKLQQTHQIVKPEPLLPIGYYANVIPIAGDVCIAVSIDGIGTKAKIAAERNVGHVVGWDVVAANVNDILCVGAKPTTFVDYISMKEIDTSRGSFLHWIIEGMTQAAFEAGVAIVGGETAVLDYSEVPEIVGVAIGVVNKADVVDGSRIKPGDVIMGLPSSGLHCNGISTAAKVDVWADMLVPTAIYVKPIRHLLDSIQLSAVNHITGGGFWNLLRNNIGYGYKLRLPPAPYVFRKIQAELGLTQSDMCHTFNMGIGMVVIADEENAALAMRLECDLLRIGEVIEEPGVHISLCGESNGL